MEKMTLYTTGCPKCRILEKKLTDKKIEFEKCEDTNKMAELGITSVPVLQDADGKMMAYFDAVKFVNSL
jgi:glutaredoxin-related protein